MVLRNDGDFAYNLAVTVDDADQQVSEVVRGADLLETTGRQLWLYEKLGLSAPSTWVHAPLMLGDDGARLAKRHGSVTLEQRLESGQSTAGVAGELASSLGLAPAGSELMPADLLDSFDWKAVAAYS